MKNVLIDFEDSFTYNIVAELYKVGIEVEVIHFQQIEKIRGAIKNNAELFVLLGPGPGNPKEYLENKCLKEIIHQMILLEKVFLVGICLGHQIIGNLLGYEVVNSNFPLHGSQLGIPAGQSSRLLPNSLNGRTISVQCYNSLVLSLGTIKKESITSDLDELLDENKQIAGIVKRGIYTYQFHPESIGTFYRSELFLYLKKTLYNYFDGTKSKRWWNL